MHTRTVVVNDRMQKGYCYERTARPGRDFDPRLHVRARLDPQEMQRLCVFCGRYMTNARGEFPRAGLRAPSSPRASATAN